MQVNRFIWGYYGTQYPLNISNCATVRSVTAKPISFWIHLNAAGIKTHVSPPKSTKRQFVCQHKFFLSVLRSIGQHLEASDSRNLPHLPEVCWSEDIPVCSSCSVLLNFVQSPDKIHRPRHQAQLHPRSVPLEKRDSYQKIIAYLSTIIARLWLL